MHHDRVAERRQLRLSKASEMPYDAMHLLSRKAETNERAAASVYMHSDESYDEMFAR